MIWFILAWMLVSFCDFPLSLFTAWGLRQKLRWEGAPYLVAVLLSSALYDAGAFFLAVNALPRASTSISIGIAVFTALHVVHTLATIALALYMLGLLNSEARGKEADVP
jgi:hypothetical protein